MGIILHKVNGKDQQCQENLIATPKLTATVLPPDNWPSANRMFLLSFLCLIPQQLLLLPFKLLKIKTQLNLFTSYTCCGQYIINWVMLLLKAMASQISLRASLIGSSTAKIKNKKIPNLEQYTLSPQRKGALVRTLRCHAALIEDLLFEKNMVRYFYLHIIDRKIPKIVGIPS